MIERKMGLQTKIAVIKLMANPTIRTLAVALKKQEPQDYDTTVVLQRGGSKTPLWLVHPGVGEILIFLSLVKHITDRPVYALRARGFDREAYFKSIPEIVSTYHSAMKRLQPKGPYAIAGYSYGGTVAFELIKMLPNNNDQVKFLGAFDQPPHIKLRMRQGDWTDTVLTLARLFDLVSEKIRRS